MGRIASGAGGGATVGRRLRGSTFDFCPESPAPVIDAGGADGGAWGLSPADAGGGATVGLRFRSGRVRSSSEISSCGHPSSEVFSLGGFGMGSVVAGTRFRSRLVHAATLP